MTITKIECVVTTIKLIPVQNGFQFGGIGTLQNNQNWKVEESKNWEVEESKNVRALNWNEWMNEFIYSVNVSEGTLLYEY